MNHAFVVLYYKTEIQKIYITINGEVFDTSRLEGKSVCEIIQPFETDSFSWKGLYEELITATGNKVFALFFVGDKNYFDYLRGVLPDCVELQHKLPVGIMESAQIDSKAVSGNAEVNIESNNDGINNAQIHNNESASANSSIHKYEKTPVIIFMLSTYFFFNIFPLFTSENGLESLFPIVALVGYFIVAIIATVMLIKRYDGEGVFNYIKRIPFGKGLSSTLLFLSALIPGIIVTVSVIMILIYAAANRRDNEKTKNMVSLFLAKMLPPDGDDESNDNSFNNSNSYANYGNNVSDLSLNNNYYSSDNTSFEQVTQSTQSARSSNDLEEHNSEARKGTNANNLHSMTQDTYDHLIKVKKQNPGASDDKILSIMKSYNPNVTIEDIRYFNESNTISFEEHNAQARKGSNNLNSLSVTQSEKFKNIESKHPGVSNEELYEIARKATPNMSIDDVRFLRNNNPKTLQEHNAEIVNIT